MKTLDEAWGWYEDVKRSLLRALRLGDRVWAVIDWENPPWKGDAVFGRLSQLDVTEPALRALKPLDDLAVVVLFSVFEATVRSAVLDQLGREQVPIHPVALRAMEGARERAEEGSFFAVLEAYKGADDSLREQVNQVRRYRNWVAHGRRGVKPGGVSAKAAYDRLSGFLSVILPPPALTEDEWLDMLRENGDRG